MANSQIAATEGSGKNIATYSFSESTTKELQRNTLNNSAGTEIGTSSNPVQVTLANGTVIPGTGATNLGKAEDAVHSSGDTGVFAMGTRQDTPTATAGSSGDYQGAAFTAQGAQWATLTPSTTGGWSVNSQTGLTNTKVAVKASAGTFGGYYLYNPNASAAYIQIFDVASGSVTLGSTTPTYVIALPASAAANLEIANGVNHTTAITLAATTTATGSTALGSALTGFFLFK